MQLFRVVVSWAGPQVHGAAVSVLHFDGSNQSAPPVAAIKGAFQAAAGLFPSGVTITVPTTGDAIEDTTGHLTGVWSGSGGGSVSCSGTANSPAGVGACIGWTTGGIVNGKKGPRKLRGRTFLVPLHGGCYDGDGTLYPTALTQAQALADALRAAGPLAIWHRPTTPGGSDGNSYGVLSGVVHDKVAFLSSRRD